MTDEIEDTPGENKAEGSSYGSAADVLGLKPKADDDLAARVQTLEADVEKYKNLADEHKDKTLRAFAEVENMRTKVLRDMKKARDFANEGILNELLPVIDSLEHAMAAVTDEADPTLEGLQLTHKMFADTLQKFGVTPLMPEGEAFDPEAHEALSMQPSPDHEPNIVIAVVQKGYLLNGRVVRPARVIVAKTPE